MVRVSRPVSADRRGTPLRRLRFITAWLALGLILCTCMPSLSAAQDKEPPFITGLLDLPISNYYLTPRGLIVENAGIVFQPILLLNANLYQGNGPLTNVTLTTGIWNSIHSKNRSGDRSTTPRWNELDFIAMLSTTFLEDWTFSIDYEYWLSPIDAFEPNSILQLKLAYADSFLKKLLPQMPGNSA